MHILKFKKKTRAPYLDTAFSCQSKQINILNTILSSIAIETFKKVNSCSYFCFPTKEVQEVEELKQNSKIRLFIIKYKLKNINFPGCFHFQAPHGRIKF